MADRAGLRLSFRLRVSAPDGSWDSPAHRQRHPTGTLRLVAAGVGLFVAFVGLRDAGIIVASSATTVAMGNLRSPQTALACIGLLFIAVLQAWRIRTAMLLGIVGTTVAGFALGIVKWHPVSYRLQDMTATALHLDIRAALHLGGTFGAGLLEIVFVFLFVDLFDNVGTLVAVTKKAGLVNEEIRCFTAKKR